MRNPEPSARQAPVFFVDSWRVYRKLVDQNYMFHREIYAELGRQLRAVPEQAFDLLDLGCGDAANLVPLLRTLPLASYCGVDLSEVALAAAAENLGGLACPVSLRQADMLDFLNREEDDRYAVIFSSFALHHLDTAAKGAFLATCHRRLRPGGRLLLIDVLREEDQSLADYLDAYCGTMASEWRVLSPEELDFAIAHVRDCDRPDSLGQLRALAAQAGFGRLIPHARHAWHHLVSLHG